jgi:phosphoribosylanthranilate isomerase
MGTRLRVKICGVTSAADALLAARLGADAVGLNFYPPSPRYVEPAAAGHILRALPPFVEPVGVFANEPLQRSCHGLQSLGGIRTLQWHGGAHEVYDVAPYRLIPAFAVRDETSLTEITRYVEACRARGHPPAAVLVDAHVPGTPGGTGQRAPWRLLTGFDAGVPLILAGGLTPENVAEAVAVVRPYAVDVASGVESSPGRKDEEKVRRFIANARAT